MTYQIQLFGITREIVGQNSLAFSAPESLNAASLLTSLKDSYPQLQKIKSLLVAVNSEYADDDLMLNISDEIALIPPVSGG